MGDKTGIFIPSEEESKRMLGMVLEWVHMLKNQRVSPDIAAYIARDMLSPMRYRPLESDSVQSHNCELPSGLVQGSSVYIPMPEEE